MANRFDKIAEKVREKTSKELDAELARHVVLTDAELAKLLPTKGDKENFARLMGIVNAQTSQNQKIAALKGNIEKLGSVMLRVMRTVT